MIRGMTRAKPTRPWLPRALLALALFAVTMLVLSWLLLSSWTTLETASAESASEAFDGARRAAGAGAATVAYLEITAAGDVVVHREQELAEPADLDTLHLVAWQPSAQRLVRVDFPFWFVALKLSGPVGLGTMIAGLVQDWENLDLGIDEDDLERRGPALVLDHDRGERGRVLLWTE
jgi:hypothetical protein